MLQFDLSCIDQSWKPIINASLSYVDPYYIQSLQKTSNWLPGLQNLFNAFSIPLANVKYILFGESPYPRAQSANGYAFWDNAVSEIWAENGLAKPVNRATSLRNFIKMLLRASSQLKKHHTSQSDIAQVSKQGLISTIDQLFGNMIQKGFLLLNTSLVLTDNPVRYDAKNWHPFIENVLTTLAERKQNIQLILLGKVAHEIDSIPISKQFKRFYAEHPYNISFIENSTVQHFFQPFKLLFQQNQ